MGGSVQWRRKNAGNGGKKPEVPKTALEQLRSRFGGKFVDDIQGQYAQGLAKGIVASADFFGDEVMNGVDITNRFSGDYKGNDVVAGETNLVGGSVWVSGGEAENSRASGYIVGAETDEDQAAQMTAHELTHVATGFTATKEIRDLNQQENDILSVSGVSKKMYEYLYHKALHSRGDKGLKLATSLIDKGVSPDDAVKLITITNSRIGANKNFCASVVHQAMSSIGMKITGNNEKAFGLSISQYASKSLVEAVAEGVSDVLINGDKAAPASKAIADAYKALKN